MSTRQLRKQARRNGAKAAGAKSPAGIQKSSQNSLKHGLTGKAIVLTNESQQQFDELHQAYVQEFQPDSTVEVDFIDQMVASQWRLRRIWRMQTAALDLKMDQQEAEIAKAFNQIDQTTRVTMAFTALANDEKALDLLLRYETAYTRMHQRALNSLLKLRKDKLRNDPEPPVHPPDTCPGLDCEELPAEVPCRRANENTDPLPSENAESLLCYPQANRLAFVTCISNRASQHGGI